MISNLQSDQREQLFRREEDYKNHKKYIGKMLTVRFQNLTALGVPRFPVGVVIRDYE